MIKKIFTLVLALGMSLPSIAADEVENQPVENAEVVLSTYDVVRDADGNAVLDEDGEPKVALVPLGEPVDLNADGTFEVNIPATVSEHKPVFAVVQDKDGTGTPLVSCVNPYGQDDAQVDATSTAIYNTFASMAEQTGFDPKDADASQLETFVETMKDTLKEVPVAENASDTIDRLGQALTFVPDALLEAAKKFNVKPEELIKVAMHIDDAAAPSGFNPFEGLPETDFEEVDPGSVTAAFLPDGYMEKHMPPEFHDFAESFCGEEANCLEPGDIELSGSSKKKGKKGKKKGVEVAEGTFVMPSGMRIDPKAELPEGIVLPMGVELPEGLELPANAIVPPGTILGEGFEPPQGLELPQGVIKPEGFDEEYEQFITHLDKFEHEGFAPPPGFGVADPETGEILLPPGFSFPTGVEVDETKVFELDIVGFIPPQPPKGHEIHDEIGEPPEGHVFPEGFIPPQGFDPEEHGFIPPAGFEPDKFEAEHHDFDTFSEDNFFDPFAKIGFDPTQDGEVPPELVAALEEAAKAHFGDEYDPDKFQEFVDGGFEEPEHHEDDCQDGKCDEHEGDFPEDGTEHPDDGNCTDATCQDDGQHHDDQNKDDQQHDDSTCQNGQCDQHDGGTEHPEGQPDDGTHHDDGAHNDGGTNPPPEGDAGSTVSPHAIADDAHPNDRRTVAVLTEEDTEVDAGVKLAVVVSTQAKAKKVTSSSGVYLTGKAKAGKSSALVNMIVDPSHEGDVSLSFEEVDNTVETTTLSVDDSDATALITQLEGKNIQMTTQGLSDTNIGLTKVVGYLLEPGTGALKIPKAIKVKGEVEEGANAQIINLKLPKQSLAAGVYTVVFQDGDDSYYGKVQIGELEERTIKGTVLAPNGQL